MYLTKMLFFYHGVGLALLFAGSIVIDQVIEDYEEPSIPRDLLLVLTAGPIEETIFFGIPYYIFGNPYSVLITGSIWASIHIFNTDSLELSRLAFGNWLFVIPSLFFSLRTWASGKGWFAIVTHSAWNGAFFGAGCATGEISCSIVGQEEDFAGNSVTLLLSAALMGVTYWLYKRRQKIEEKNKRLAL